MSLLEIATLPGETNRNATCCFSYLVTSCFQHVYLATSTLWGEGSLLGASSDEVEFDNNFFRYVIIIIKLLIRNDFYAQIFLCQDRMVCKYH